VKLLLDMNLSPSWVPALEALGHEVVHWSSVGDPRAPDREVLAYARAHHQVLLTHDLDFGRLLALTGAQGPSVVQARTQDVLPGGLLKAVGATLEQYEPALSAGALVVIEKDAARVRILPLLRQVHPSPR
jgi:predicted nuclease of predicted toxin-antitoxin system